MHTHDLVEDLVGHSLRVVGTGGKVRVIPLDKTLADELAQLPAGYVFPGKIDGHLSPDRVGARPRRPARPGMDRALAAAYAAQRELFAVQRLLGHSKLDDVQEMVGS